MGHRICGSTAVFSASLFALVGCQNFSGFSTSAASATAKADAAAQQAPALAPIKNMRGSSKEHLEAALTTAQVMENSGKYAEAAYHYEQIRELDPKREIFCARHLAILYDRKGDFDKALDEYAKLFAANPKDAAAFNDLGYGYYTRGKFEAAEKNLRKSVELDPKSKRTWSNLGMALAQLGRYEESLAAFEKSVNRPQAMCNVAFIQASQGKWVEARDSYSAALQLEPGLQKARVALQSMTEGRGNKERDRQEARRKAREMGELPEIDPNFARNLPFGLPTGMVGSDSGMVYIAPGDQPINLPMPGSTPLPAPTRMSPAAANSAAALPSLPPPLPNVEPSSLPPAPTGLVVD